MFADLFVSIITGILSGFLLVSGTVADRIESIFGIEEHSVAASTEPIEAVEDKDPESLESLYEYGGAIPDILINNTSFQEASLDEDGQPHGEVEGAELSPEDLAKDALVNIYCTYKTDAYERTTAGTGFFISDKGVILTNAHVAQFLILESVSKTGKTDCIVRAGSPAVPLYEAELLYISPLWISEHAKLIDTAAPKGTGERDYALLYIARSIDTTPLPARFTALPFDTSLLPRSTEGGAVLAAGYPAEKFFTEGRKTSLYGVVASTTVHTLYTFGSKYADIFSIANSEVGEHGASGGPVIDPLKGVIGLIVTKGDIEKEGSKSLRALTLSYVDRTIKEETGFTLAENLRGDLAYRGKVFQDALVPFLAEVLTRELE